VSIITRWPSGHLHRVTYTRCRIDTISSPDDGHIAVRNTQRIEINVHEKELCVQLVISKDVLVHWEVPDLKVVVVVVVVKFMTVFFSSVGVRLSYWLVNLSPLWPPVHNNILWIFRHTSIGQLLMLDQGCGRETSPSWVRRQYSWEKLERASWKERLGR